SVSLAAIIARGLRRLRGGSVVDGESSRGPAHELRLLYAEDDPRDAKLSLRRLQQEGFQPIADVVGTQSEFVENLSRNSYDVVLADYRMRDWTGMDALEILQGQGKQIPLILVSGTVGEETAVLFIKKGGTDFVLKDRLASLPLAVKRALRDVAQREEQKRAEAAVRQNEETIRLLLESTAEGIYGLDLEGNCTFCNPACLSLLGFREMQDLAGRNMHRLIHHTRPDGSPYPGDDCPLDSVLRSGTGAQLADEVFWRADESSFRTECLSTPIRRDGELIGAVVTFLDVTERRRLEQHLTQSQKMEAVGRLAGGIAHDFNNHLGIIIGYSERILGRMAPDDPLRANVGRIKEAAMRSAALTRQLLAFSRRQVLEPTILDLNAAVTELGKMVRPLIGENIGFVTLLDPDLGKVRVDAGQIDQVVMNLVVNARDALPDGGTITIETRNTELDEEYARSHGGGVKPGRYVVLAVSDNGAGMDKETQAHIFEPFFTTKEKSKGTGLGLATVYGIIKQSGGFIWVYSELGHGTTFKIYFPRALAPDRDVWADSSEAPIPPGAETILVVEDEESLRDVACSFLRDGGYTVMEAANGDEAIHVAKQYDGPIHLLMTDAVLPGMSGREVAEYLRACRRELKVLYVSGYTDDAILRHGLVHTDAAFLQKPYTRNLLLLKVSQLLDADGSANQGGPKGVNP
ncbi:MAG: response regulator, partial [Gammaproteobacteria bacterium]